MSLLDALFVAAGITLFVLGIVVIAKTPAEDFPLAGFVFVFVGAFVAITAVVHP